MKVKSTGRDIRKAALHWATLRMNEVESVALATRASYQRYVYPIIQVFELDNYFKERH